MLSKSQYLYQAKLVIDQFPEEEYNLIPVKTLKYIEENMQADPNIKIDTSKSLEEQELDPQTWDFLEKMVDEVSNNQFYEEYKDEADDCYKLFEEQNKGYVAMAENKKLNNEISGLKAENEKIPQAKELVLAYKNLIQEKEEEIRNLKLKNNSLEEQLSRIPKFIKLIFIRNKIKKLNENNE